MELLHLLQDVDGCATGHGQHRAVWHQAQMVLAAAEREIVEAHDVEAVRRAAAAVGTALTNSARRPAGGSAEP